MPYRRPSASRASRATCAGRGCARERRSTSPARARTCERRWPGGCARAGARRSPRAHATRRCSVERSSRCSSAAPAHAPASISLNGSTPPGPRMRSSARSSGRSARSNSTGVATWRASGPPARSCSRAPLAVSFLVLAVDVGELRPDEARLRVDDLHPYLRVAQRPVGVVDVVDVVDLALRDALAPEDPPVIDLVLLRLLPGELVGELPCFLPLQRASPGERRSR